MTTITFDSLSYFERLKAAGVPEAQAKVQVEIAREQSENQAKILQTKIDECQKHLVSNDDLSGVQLEIQNVRLEVEKVRADVEKVRAEVERVKYDLLKWQLGIALALAAIMAKGFGWLGF